MNGEVRNYEDCRLAVSHVDYVLHHTALSSVPRSIADPIATNSVNISGFINMLTAAKECGVDNFTYATSSTYGDHSALPKVEENIGSPLSPYTAIIPKWISAMIKGEDIEAYGGGKTSRALCYIDNVVEMNIISSVASENFKDSIYNVAVGDRHELSQLYKYIKKELIKSGVNVSSELHYQDYRTGDVRHSQENINKAVVNLGYSHKDTPKDGLLKSIGWYINNVTS